MAAAMWSAARNVTPRPHPGPGWPTLPRYAWWLIGSYLTSTATPQVMLRLRDRLQATGRPALAAFAEQKAKEETGHDRLAMKDLEALGLPAGALVAAIRPTRHALLVAYFEASVDGSEPVSAFGYTYVLERAVLANGQPEIDAIRKICPPGVHATRTFQVHSNVGADAGHVGELLVEVARMAARDRHIVAQATYDTARLLNQPRDDDLLDDTAIRHRLEAVAGRLPEQFYATAATGG